MIDRPLYYLADQKEQPTPVPSLLDKRSPMTGGLPESGCTEHTSPCLSEGSQSPQAKNLVGSPDAGLGVTGRRSNRGDAYTNESHKIYDGDISKLMGGLA